MIGVHVKKGDNPNEVVLQGQATGNVSGTWNTLITIPPQCGGELRTLNFSAGHTQTGAWELWALRIQRGLLTLWTHTVAIRSTQSINWRPFNLDVGVETQPGDTIDFYLTGTPSFSVVGDCTATVLLPATASRFQSEKSYPICGLYFVDTGRPDICRLAALSTLLGYMLHSDPHLFGGIPTRMEAL